MLKRVGRAPRPGPQRRWRVVASPDVRLFDLEAVAATKSEARAALKRSLGLSRLPAGTRLEGR